MQELLSFDWCGKMAHFRKFYSNASALSHTLPPRTTILGLLASIAEIERDSYYIGTENEVFNSLQIGIQLVTPVRKITQKLNYLKIVKEGASEESVASEIKDIYVYRGYSNRKQVSTELIVPYNMREPESIVRYRVFIGFPDKAHPTFDKLRSNLLQEYYPFGVCLGAANMLGYIERPLGKAPISFTTTHPEGYVEVVSAIEESLISTLNGIDPNHNFSIEHDLFPTSFRYSPDLGGRIADSTKVMLYSADGNPLRLQLNSMDNIYFLPHFNQYIYLL